MLSRAIARTILGCAPTVARSAHGLPDEQNALHLAALHGLLGICRKLVGAKSSEGDAGDTQRWKALSVTDSDDCTPIDRAESSCKNALLDMQSKLMSDFAAFVSHAKMDADANAREVRG